MPCGGSYPSPQQICQVPCCMPLSYCPGCQPPAPRNCCPSYWPPIVYQPPAQKICVIVNNCPKPHNDCSPGCKAPQLQRNDGACGSQQQQPMSCGQPQNQGNCCGQPQQQQSQCQYPPVHVEYVTERQC